LSESEVLKLIDTVGRTPPDWFASTPLDYPSTLDLDWPLKPLSQGWNNQKHVELLRGDINVLAGMYFELFQDDARAAGYDAIEFQRFHTRIDQSEPSIM
jgi:hypothetical protein